MCPWHFKNLESWPYRQYHQLLLEREGPNDGLVSVNSAKWGKYLGTFAIKHHEFCRTKSIFDTGGEIGQAENIHEQISMLHEICRQMGAVE